MGVEMVIQTVQTPEVMVSLILALPVEDRVIASGQGFHPILLGLGKSEKIVVVKQGNQYRDGGGLQVKYTISVESPRDEDFYRLEFNEAGEILVNHCEASSPFPVRLVSVRV